MSLAYCESKSGRFIQGSFNKISDLIAESVTNSVPGAVRIFTYVNVSNFYRLWHDEELSTLVACNCVSFVEGVGMRFGIRLQADQYVHEFNQTDAFPLVMEKLSDPGARIFLFGAEEKVVKLAARVIGDRWPQIQVTGTHHGYCSRPQEKAVANIVRESGADLLLVGRGFGLQEEFSVRYADEMGVKAIWNVGGLFDFVSGARKRAPATMRFLRLEWLYRLLCEPTRLWQRSLVHAPWFVVQSMRGHAFFKFGATRRLIPTGED